MKVTAVFSGLIFVPVLAAQAISPADAVARIRASVKSSGKASPLLTQRFQRPAAGPWLPASHDGPCSVRMPGTEAMKNWQGDPKMATSPATPQTMPQATVPAPPCPAK